MIFHHHNTKNLLPLSTCDLYHRHHLSACIKFSTKACTHMKLKRIWMNMTKVIIHHKIDLWKNAFFSSPLYETFLSWWSVTSKCHKNYIFSMWEFVFFFKKTAEAVSSVGMTTTSSIEIQFFCGLSFHCDVLFSLRVKKYVSVGLDGIKI